MTDPDDTQGNPKSQATTVVNSTDGLTIRFPPFPTQLNTGEGASIIPFKHFKEHGIRIFSDTGVEMDGLGIPTVELDVIHDLDECKTETRRKLKDGKEGKRGKIATAVGEAPVGEPVVKLNPMEKAKDRRTQRFLLFAKKEWFDQWSEGEHLRGLKTYDLNLSSITRIHQASTDFRTGRIWPPAHTQLMYLWDQFRLYAGLLGAPPIWTRTDLPQPEEVNDEDENEVEGGPTRSSAPPGPNLDVEVDLASDFDDDDDEFIPNISQTRPTNKSEYPQRPPQPPRRRFPLRTPYELFNKDPIPVSSDAEVHALLARAAVKKETRLLAFLSDPEKSVKVFLSSYMRKEGLIWTPSFLTYLPLLLSFYLSFLIRTRALPECDRQLKRALEIAREAATQLPCTGRLCRILPDAMGKGAKGCWGTKWEYKWDSGLIEKNDSKPTEALPDEEALKMFEDEVKKANLQLLSKETIFGPERIAPISVNEQSDDEQINIQIMSPTSPEPKTPTALINNQLIPETTNSSKNTVHTLDEQSDDEQISIQIMSPTSPEPKTPTALINNQLIPKMTNSSKNTVHTLEKPNWALAPDIPALPDSPPPLPPAQSFTTVVGSVLPPSNLKEKETQISDDESEASEEDPRSWASPTGRPLTRSQKLAEKVPWFPPPTQPLMGILGMTVLPLRYENGIAERSLRKVTSVLKPGEGRSGGGGGGKWRGVEEELVKRFARVVLEPWLDWGSEGIAPEFKTPMLVGGGTLSSLDSTKTKEGDENGKSTHDPLKDDITILVEPSVANSLSVGMGMAGTWVQMIPLKSDYFGDDGGSRGRGGGAKAGRKEQRFWYVEELSLAIPSFWTVGEEVEEIEADEEDIAHIGRRWSLKK